MIWKSSSFGNSFWCVTILLLYLAWHSEATKSKTIDNMVEALKNKKVDNLTCHVCHSETDSNCFNFTGAEDIGGFSQQCENDHKICMVRKFSFTSTTEQGTSPMKTFAVKRNCTDKCEDGCVIMGERTRLYVCSQCCQTPLCNVGSGVGSIHDSKSYFFKAASVRLRFLENTGSSFLHFVQIFVTVVILRFPF